MNELQQLHTLVWRFREQVEPFWKTPEPLDCLRYAFCEAAEAMDVWLRLNRPEDSRNTVKTVTEDELLDELADCAIMLLSAIGSNDLDLDRPRRLPEYDNLEPVCSHVAQALIFTKDDSLWLSPLIAALCWIRTYPGMNLDQRIRERLKRIAKKHAPYGRLADKIIDAAGI